jgi:hypothetical protein
MNNVIDNGQFDHFNSKYLMHLQPGCWAPGHLNQ